MVNIAVFASGSGTNFENIVRRIQDQSLHHVTCAILIVDHDDAGAIERAKMLHIPYQFVNPKEFANKEAYETSILQILTERKVDLIVLAGYMRYIGTVLLAAYPQRIMNIHPAYLPSFPGAHGIRDAYEAKVPCTGVTVHYVDEGVDTGAIIDQRKLPIDPKWSLEQLEEHVHALEYELFPHVIQRVVDQIEEGNK